MNYLGWPELDRDDDWPFGRPVRQANARPRARRGPAWPPIDPRSERGATGDDQRASQKAEEVAEPPVQQREAPRRDVPPPQRAAAATASGAPEEVAGLREALDRARASEAELVKEFANYRRHAEANLARAESKAEVELLAELADTVQALELAGGAADTDPEAVRQGVVLVARNLKKVFETRGLSRIATAGAAFDPAEHEAVLVERAEGVDKGVIVRELSPGFRTEERVIRPAKVSVAA